MSAPVLVTETTAPAVVSAVEISAWPPCRWIWWRFAKLDQFLASSPAVSGVRSSWEALAMKFRCAWNDASSRPNRSSSVWPSSVNSSPRPRTPSRRCRLLAEMSRAVVMIERSGRTKRPAISQPAAREITAAITRTAASLRNAAELTVRGTPWVGCPAVTAPD
jgi:hypothetical protein